MKAIICENYGAPDVLQLKEVQTPTPANNEILIKIHTTSVNSGDVRIRKADPYIIRLFFGFSRPKQSILGVVVSGVITAVGKNVTKFKVGDRVYGSTGMKFGAYAEYITLSEDATLSLLPTHFSHEEAAAIPFGATASMHFLERANIKPGQKALIYGASGALGTAGIQLAKSFGAHVTAVCSTSNMALVKSLGADEVIDYTKEDFTSKDVKYDVIYDTVNKSEFCPAFRSLKKNGTMLLASAGIPKMLFTSILSLFTKKRIISGVIKESADDMKHISSLIETGKLKAVIDQTFSFAEMAAAHAYVDKGHKKGNVVIKVA
ncbi:MAG: NAD(P)-dependent alcohol dehydrogenase [Saprospiraceae bacterium]|nr:NAD(P)-dependent alcohol dehydrogenase [Saprospiraceae bacterium]